MATCLEIFAKFNQLVLFLVNLFVALLGLAVMIVGAWAKADGRKYFEIADDTTEYTQVSVLLIVVGIFVFIIGVVGAVGALFASKVFGRIILMVYAIGLGLLIVCEIAGGIAAAVARDQLENVFRDSANSTFRRYLESSSERSTWDTFQKEFECCGVEGYLDYHYIFGYDNNSVPLSCCNKEKVKKASNQNCTTVTYNVTQEVLDSKYIYTEGCSNAIVDAIKKNLGAVAGVAIFLALVQIVGVVMACFVALYRREKSYEVV